MTYDTSYINCDSAYFNMTLNILIMLGKKNSRRTRQARKHVKLKHRQN